MEAKMFLTRCKDASKKNSLYFTSMLVRDIVVSNVERVKITNTGVKAFCKCENKGADCSFRYSFWCHESPTVEKYKSLLRKTQPNFA